MDTKRWFFGMVVLLAVMAIGTTSFAAKVEITRYATDGYVTMPDGRKIYVFGFTDDPKGDAKIPAPTIIINEGDDLYLTLVNKGMTRSENLEGHTIHPHGFLVPAMFDGVPEFSVSVPPLGGKFTYYIKAEKPGTYIYHCHVRAPVHIEMGMYGMIIVRAKKGEHYVYNDESTYFDREYAYVLSEYDYRVHDAESKKETCCGKTFNIIDEHPQYWIANVPFPDTLKDPHLLKIKQGEKILVRMLNIGQESHAMHIHGMEFTIVGKDQNMLKSPIVSNTLHIAPGETFDLIITLPDKEENPEYAKVLRYKQGLDEMFPWHDHMDYKATNNGVFPGGMFIPIKVIPPDSKEQLTIFNHP